MTFLSVSGVSKKRNNDFIVQRVTFTQPKLRRIALAGETGAGKSTLLKMIAGLEQADAGEIVFENKRVEGPADKLVPGHPSIAYLSQYFDLPHSLRVEQVLAYANTLSDEAVDELYKICQIDHLLKRRTDQLSGGERQRIALTRLLIGAPKLLLLDEPFSNLDSVHKGTLKTIIHNIGEQLKITCILISHDPLDTLPWADEIMVMKDGSIIQQGTPEEIYKKPTNEYVAGLFGKYSLLTHELAASFASLLSLPAESHQRMLIRPENFLLVTKKSQGLKGIVQAVRFFGRYYEVDVIIENDTITIIASNGVPTVDEPAYMSIREDDIWYLS
jgi:iron(III) transport system ATP-binding protein